MRAAALALLALAVALPARAQVSRQEYGGRAVLVRTIAVPADGVELATRAIEGVDPAVPIVALHGCGGPFAARDAQWIEILAAAGFNLYFPDSFASRGLGPQCNVRERTVRPGRERRADTVAAVRYVLGSTASRPGGAFVLGWSNGASTTLWAAETGVLPEGAVRAFVAFYPGCREILDHAAWTPGAPILILIGEADDWTPAQPCRDLAARFPDRITLMVEPGAYHDFDVPNRPVRESYGRAYTATGTGTVHAGTNEPARQDAITRVQTFLNTH